MGFDSNTVSLESFLVTVPVAVPVTVPLERPALVLDSKPVLFFALIFDVGARRRRPAGCSPSNVREINFCPHCLNGNRCRCPFLPSVGSISFLLINTCSTADTEPHI